MLEVHLVEARKFVSHLKDRLDLWTVILDDWAGIRLVYETADVAGCTNDCGRCPTFLALGEDQAQPAGTLRTTLKPATTDHTDVTVNRMLNCKTPHNYADSFVRWLARRCVTDQDYRDELDLVFGFRVVYLKGAESEEDLEAGGWALKRKIIERALDQTDDRGRRHIGEYLCQSPNAAATKNPAWTGFRL